MTPESFSRDHAGLQIYLKDEVAQALTTRGIKPQLMSIASYPMVGGVTGLRSEEWKH
jgi:hypothetical protein